MGLRNPPAPAETRSAIAAASLRRVSRATDVTLCGVDDHDRPVRHITATAKTRTALQKNRPAPA